jgi:hypothetical protein
MPYRFNARSSWLGDCSVKCMLQMTDVRLSENARILAKYSRSVVSLTPLEPKHRAEGEFLRKLVAELQPMLRLAMRSRRIFLARDPHGAVMLKSNGTFVHVDLAHRDHTLEPVQVLAAEPNLLAILHRIEAELSSVAGPRAASAASVVRFARYSLAAAAAA